MLLSLFILLCIFLINFIFLDWSTHFYSGRKAELEAQQRIRMKSTIFYLISIICCLQHWNIMLIRSWKKSNTKFLLFLSFCNSKTSTITRNAQRRKKLEFFKMIFFPDIFLVTVNLASVIWNSIQFPRKFYRIWKKK